jgi:hypothetical protein
VAKLTIREIIFLAAAIVTILGYIQQQVAASQSQATAQADLDRAQAAIEKARAENAALMTISLPGFLQTYNFHIQELRVTAEAFEKAKGAKGADIPGSEAANKLARAENDLFVATDIFTDFVDRWRAVAQSVDKLLDGNVTQLKNSRSENNTADVDAVAQRIVREAPDLATPLRVALDKLKPPSREKK